MFIHPLLGRIPGRQHRLADLLRIQKNVFPANLFFQIELLQLIYDAGMDAGEHQLAALFLQVGRISLQHRRKVLPRSS